MTYRIKATDIRSQIYTVEASDTDEATKKLDDAINKHIKREPFYLISRTYEVVEEKRE